MATNVKKKLFLLVFCLASVTQGMYSTYLVSILTTIEKIYQIQSKTAGAIMSATEVGQIFGSLLIAYYGGKGNKPKWIAACMTLMAAAALISTSPYFLLKPAAPATDSTLISPYLTSDLSFESSLLAQKISNLPKQEQLCYLKNDLSAEPLVLNSTATTAASKASISGDNLASITNQYYQQGSRGPFLVIFSLCLLTIGFGSTAITTLGIPFLDDIVSKEESPLYLGLSIGLKIFGPALGFLLGSFCIRLDLNLLAAHTSGNSQNLSNGIGAWWLGLIIISSLLLILAFPMYYLSRLTITSRSSNDDDDDEFKAITYQAAEDHDIGGSRDFQTHVLTIGDVDVTSNRTCYSEVDSSSREVLQTKPAFHYNFSKNITLEQPNAARERLLNDLKVVPTDVTDNCAAHSRVVLSRYGVILESTSSANEEAKSLHSSSSSSHISSHHPPPPPSSSASACSIKQPIHQNLMNSLTRLIKNELLLLRMLSAILHILPIAGFYTFFPKYLIEQFRIAPSSANAISGLAGILSVGVGAFLGGTIVRILNVNSRLMSRWIAASALLYAIGMLILLNLGCPQNQTIHQDSDFYMSTDCLADCQCSSSIYSPVCANGTTYMSPCLAGCKNYTLAGDKIIYNECGCSSNQQAIAVGSSAGSNDNATSNYHDLNVATQGHCLLDCDNLPLYIVIFSIFTLMHASCEVGSMMFNLRCVKSNDRTLALGLITLTSSLLGTIPCSVIYGTMIDLTCIHWDTLSPQPLDAPEKLYGACRAYKNDTFRYYLHGVTAFVMFLAFLVDCLICRRAKQVDFYDKNDSIMETTQDELKESTQTI